jgi:hypothetical protein
MRVTGPFESMVRGGSKAPSALARPVEKPNASSDLKQNTQDFTRHREKAPRRLQVELVCQDDTKAFDPFWDGPRLQPSFVTQLLGQVMPGRETMKNSAQAYGAAPVRSTGLFDRKS